MLFVGDPVTTALDPRGTAIGAFCLTLFITNSIFLYKVWDKISSIASTQTTQDSKHTEQERNTARLIVTADSILKNQESKGNKFDDVVRNIGENRMQLDTMLDQLRAIEQQQTVLATAQLTHTQNMGKIVDGLLEALSEHSKN
jgi:hypothetical protein